nr:uncharacterized protein LOC129154495 [Nothobranchius furzeri]
MMEKEYDCGTEDDGWGPNDILSTLGEQLACIETVINMTSSPVEATRNKVLLRKSAEKAMKEKGVDVNSRGNWSKIWEVKAAEAREKRQEAAETLREAGVLARKKVKSEVDKQAARVSNYMQWIMLWNAARPNMKRVKKENKSPPPYSSAAPTAGMYPLIKVTSGTLDIQPEVPLDNMSEWSSVTMTSGSDVKVRPSAPETHNPFLISNETLNSSPSANNSAAPFELRAKRQDIDNSQKQFTTPYFSQGLVAPDYSTGMSSHAPPPAPWVNCPPVWPKAPDQKQTPIFASSQLKGEEQEDPNKSVVVKMVLVGHESSDPPPAASQSHESLLEEEWPEPPTKEEFGGEGDLLSRPQSPEPERRHSRSMGPPTYQLPLVQNKPNAQKVYQPYSLGDIQALIDKLPDIQEGGNTWLSDFDTLTAGQDLALGDFRAVITRCTSRSQAEALEKDAGTTRDSNSVPLGRVIAQLGPAVRRMFPLKDSSSMCKFKWDAKQNPSIYLNQAIDTWVAQTGQHPSKWGTSSMWFKNAVLKGVPDLVTQKMEDNPDLQDCDFSKWKKHLIFNLNKMQVKEEKDSDDLEDLQKQLLRVQLQAAKKTLGEKGDKVKKQMVASTATPPPQQTLPDQVSPIAWQPQTPYSGQPQPQYSGPYVNTPNPYAAQRPPFTGRTRGGFRGRGQWRPVGGKGGPRAQDICYNCGQPGHWYRNCPLPYSPQKEGQGRGTFSGRGGPTGPHTQMPMMGWEQWEGGPRQ